MPAGIQNIEHRAVGAGAVGALRDRFRQDGFKLDEVAEFTTNPAEWAAAPGVDVRDSIRLIAGPIRQPFVGVVRDRLRGERTISARGQPHAGAQEFLWVDRFAIDPGFVMQMRTGRSAG